MEILIKPVVTEKASFMNEEGKYSFVVANQANKIQIKEAVEKIYGVTIEKVWTQRYQGKKKTRYTKRSIIEGRRPSFKKAIVKVADGEVIDFYDNI